MRDYVSLILLNKGKEGKTKQNLGRTNILHSITIYNRSEKMCDIFFKKYLPIFLFQVLISSFSS